MPCLYNNTFRSRSVNIRCSDLYRSTSEIIKSQDILNQLFNSRDRIYCQHNYVIISNINGFLATDTIKSNKVGYITKQLGVEIGQKGSKRFMVLAEDHENLNKIANTKNNNICHLFKNSNGI